MYKGGRLTICDRLTQIKESIYYIQQWSKEINCADYVRRLNYLDHPDANKWGVRFMVMMTF